MEDKFEYISDSFEMYMFVENSCFSSYLTFFKYAMEVILLEV